MGYLFTAVRGSLEPPSEGPHLAVAAGLPRPPFNLSDNRYIPIRTQDRNIAHAKNLVAMKDHLCYWPKPVACGTAGPCVPVVPVSRVT